MNLQKAEREKEEKAGIYLSIIFLAAYLIFMPLSGLIILNNQHNLKNKEFLSRFGAFIEGFNFKNYVSKYYFVI